MELRLGAEQKVGRLFTLRGGYNSATGVSVGAGVFGVNLAYSKRAPLQIVRTPRF